MKVSASAQSCQGHISRKFALAVGAILALLLATGGVGEAQAIPGETHEAHVSLEPTVETLRLSCNTGFANGQRGVACQWSEATSPQIRGYKLFRITDGQPRQLVATTGADGRLGYFDTDVSSPSLLTYGVISVDRSGHLIGRSAPMDVQFGQVHEQLRMSCSPDSLEGQRGVLCRWSETAHPDARGYLVYRIAEGEPREVIARVPVDGRTGHFDRTVEAGGSYVYGVTAVDGDGLVIGVGGPQLINWPGVR